MSESQLKSLHHFCGMLIDQEKATPIVMPQQPESGFWFGGGNMIQDEEGHLLVVGRYRNAGDSRTGIAAGTRGLELAIFRSIQPAGSTAELQFEKAISWSKEELNCDDQQVLSIEGSCLRRTNDGYQLFVSTEKSNVSYPDEIAAYLKPGAGVWTIDVLNAPTLAQLKQASVHKCLQSDQPEHLHVKDPFFWDDGTKVQLGFCSHPFNWSSSNTGRVSIGDDGLPSASPCYNVVPRGTTWDVAMTRGTAVMRLPDYAKSDQSSDQLLFYCGGECVRELDQHATAVKRPRGYSCEELGGAMLVSEQQPAPPVRLSRLTPMFVSPMGTGCSRYVDVCATKEGFFATWQQSQTDLSQPLVMNFLSHEQARRCF